MNKVAVVRIPQPQYPAKSPYNPSKPYPEYPFPGQLAGEINHVYAGVRQLFYKLGLDLNNYGAKTWNPLGFLVEPGMTVVLKPNFVLSRNKGGSDLFAIITHPSVLRVVGDYCWIALQGKGRLVIADAPQYDCNFSELLAATQLEQVRDFYVQKFGLQAEILDLRKYWSRGKHFPSMEQPLPGDPQGNLLVNLGKYSALYGKPHADKLYGAVYRRNETISHHSGERHEYELSRTIMNADVVISIPKLKVHKKVGVTLNAKGLVGVATNKNYLVHYTLTTPDEGGDQFPENYLTQMESAIIRIERWMYDHFLAPRILPLEYLHRSIYWLHNHTTRCLGIKVQEYKRLLDAGNWYGNDSAWRMTVDLMRAFHFADSQGNLQFTRQRRAFSIIDGIIGGDNNGPLIPDAVPAGTLVAGENLLAVDIVATRLMGFDPLKMRMYREMLQDQSFDFGVHNFDDIEVLCDEPGWQNCLYDPANHFLNFRPHPGWIGHLEIQPEKENIS